MFSPHMATRIAWFLAATSLLLPISHSDGQTLSKQAFATNLNYPTGVAVHPINESIYVADSGHDKIIRFLNGKAEVVISNAQANEDNYTLHRTGGPRGIVFSGNGKQLFVGLSGGETDQDRIGIYDVESLPTTFDGNDHATSITIAPQNDNVHRHFFGIACDTSNVWITGIDNPESGWVYQISEHSSATLRDVVNTWKSTQTQNPTAITISPAGFLLVGLRGDLKNSSVLGFFDRETGVLKARFDIGVAGLIALAYHPINGKLYGLINNPKTPENNGLYKLVARARNTKCEALMQMQIANPWAMAFSKSGDLWVTSGRESGTLWKISQSNSPPPKNP